MHVLHLVLRIATILTHYLTNLVHVLNVHVLSLLHLEVSCKVVLLGGLETYFADGSVGSARLRVGHSPAVFDHLLLSELLIYVLIDILIHLSLMLVLFDVFKHVFHLVKVDMLLLVQFSVYLWLRKCWWDKLLRDRTPFILILGTASDIKGDLALEESVDVHLTWHARAYVSTHWVTHLSVLNRSLLCLRLGRLFESLVGLDYVFICVPKLTLITHIINVSSSLLLVCIECHATRLDILSCEASPFTDTVAVCAATTSSHVCLCLLSPKFKFE